MKLYTFDELDTDIQDKMIERFVTINNTEELKRLEKEYSIVYDIDDIPDFAEENLLDCGRVFDEKGEDLTLYLLELS